jgi:hypothetical protein
MLGGLYLPTASIGRAVVRATGIPISAARRRKVFFVRRLASAVHAADMATLARLCAESVAVAAYGIKPARAMNVEGAIPGSA